MKKRLNDDVDRFIEYFNKMLIEIQELKIPLVEQNETCKLEIFQRLLYASVIDTLAGSVPSAESKSPKKGNRDRFIHFVQRFCLWPDGEKVSLTHLVQLLRKNPDSAFNTLREWALEEYKKLTVHEGELMSISQDPSFDEVNCMWPTQKNLGTPLERIDLISLNHFHLLYAYRNTLVHELRTPGYGMEFRTGGEPYYHLMSTVSDGDETEDTVELVYPRGFLHQLCETALKQLEHYFLENVLNPYDSLVFGTYWIKELNH